jgi:hypothetical protein
MQNSRKPESFKTYQSIYYQFVSKTANIIEDFSGLYF